MDVEDESEMPGCGGGKEARRDRAVRRKYGGDVVRVVNMGGKSNELCGEHACGNTRAKVGPFRNCERVLRASGVRRMRR